jgi:HAMP domain-containing protein
MSQIQVFSELVFRADAARTAIRALESEVRGMAQRVSNTRISIPVTVEDHASRAIRQIALTVTEMRPSMTVRLDTKGVDQQLADLQARVAAVPIIVPTVPSVAGGAAGAASPANVLAAQGRNAGFFSGLFTRRAAFSALFAVHGLNQLASRFDNTGDVSRLEDPMKQLEAMRAQIEKEHQGVQGWIQAIYGHIGKLGLEIRNPITGTHISNIGQPTFDEEMKRLDDAEKEMRRTQNEEARTRKASQARYDLRQMIKDMGEEADASGLDDIGKRRESIEGAFKKATDTIDKMDQTWQLYGKDYPTAEKLFNQARALAERIRKAGVQAVDAEAKARQETQAGRVSDIQERGAEAGLRAEGFDALANFRAREAAIDRPVRALKIRFTEEQESGQSEKARGTAKELEAEEDAAVQEHRQNLVEYRKALRAELRRIQDVQTNADALTLTTGGRPGEARLTELRQNIESQIEAAEGNPALQAALANRGLAQLEAERKRLRGEPRLQGIDTLGNQLLTAGFRSDNLDDRSALENRIDEMEQRFRAMSMASGIDAQFRAMGFNLGLSETLGFGGQNGGSPFGDAPEKLDEAGTKLSNAGDKLRDVLDRATHIAVLDA